MKGLRGCAATLLICASAAEAAEPTMVVRCQAPPSGDSEALKRSLTLYLQEHSPIFVDGAFSTLEADTRARGARFAVWCELTSRRTFRGVLLDLSREPAETSGFELSPSETASTDFARLAGLKVRSLASLAQFKDPAPAVLVPLTPTVERTEPWLYLSVAAEWTASNAFKQSLFGLGGQAAVRLGAFRVGLGVRWHQPEFGSTAEGRGLTERLHGALIVGWKLPEVALFSSHFAVAQLGGQRLVTTGTLLETGERRAHTSLIFMVSVGYLMSWHVVGPLWLSFGPRVDVLTAPVTVYVRETPVFTAALVSPALELRIGLGL